ncbi:hypothetical protein [Paracoccus sp. Ld10]|uniref:hypothetical protein n=1 Tax=Paracoccus sp. Ld10 TaxID=649158 RepID=UPI0038694675
MPHFDNHGLKGGVWRGHLSGIDAPEVRVVLVHHAEILAEARLTPDGPGCWQVETDLPADVLSDGLQTLLLKTAAASGADSGPDGHVLARLSLMAGQPLDEDLIAEIAALRAELELVKRELRRFAAGVAGR